MNLADDSKLTDQLTACSPEVFRALIDLGEKVNAEYGNKPGNPIAFSHLVVSMCGWLSEMFPGHTATIQLEGSYFQETGVVDLPNLVPVIEKIVQERKEQETRTLFPTKGETAPMSQPITEQDVADYLTKYIQTSELVPDAMKALFIGRVTNWDNPAVQQGEQVPLRREMCPGFGWALEKLQQGNKVRRAGWNGSQMWLQLQRPDQYSKMTLPYIYMEYPKGHIAHPDGCRIPWLASQSDMLSYDWQIVSDMPVPSSAPSASVARTPDTTEPLTMSITRDDDGHMCIAIADRKWKIMRHGMIGDGNEDRDDFHRAASDLVKNQPLCKDWLAMHDALSFYRISMRYRASLKMTLGQVAYEAFANSYHSDPAEHQAWEAVGEIEKAKWEGAGQAAYLSIGLEPSEINRELQVLAARKRMLLLRSVGIWGNDIQKTASEIALIAGPTPQT